MAFKGTTSTIPGVVGLQESAPTPRRRGRPTKSETLARRAQNDRSPEPSSSQIKLTPFKGGPTDSVRREGRKNRGKPPKKFEPDLETPVKRVSSHPSGRKSHPSIALTAESTGGKENENPRQTAVPDVNINLAVNNKQYLPHLKDVGMYILYFCKKCVFQSKKLSDITDHLSSGENCVAQTPLGENSQEDKGPVLSGEEDHNLESIDGDGGPATHIQILDRIAKDELAEKGAAAGCDGTHAVQFIITETKEKEVVQEEGDEDEETEAYVEADSDEDADYNVQEEEDLEEDEGEHNYADDVKEADEDKELGYEEGLDDDPGCDIIEQELEGEMPESYRWRCTICAYTRLYSEREQEEHTRCHGPNGKGKLHCYLCKMDGNKRCLKGLEWYRLKAHLHTTHAVDFELQCNNCDEIHSSHRQFMKHYRTHSLSCEHCSYKSGNQEDMELHLKCHLVEDVGKFACPLCDYRSESQPGKWSVLHTHLVNHHAGAITPLFRCAMCKKGFQELRAYRKHKKSCSEDPMVECELCHTSISKSRLITHAIWHVRSAEEADRKKRAEEQKTKAEESSDAVTVETEPAVASAASILTSLGQGSLERSAQQHVAEAEEVPEVGQSTEVTYKEEAGYGGQQMTLEIEGTEMGSQAVLLDTLGHDVVVEDAAPIDQEIIVHTAVGQDGNIVVENISAPLQPEQSAELAHSSELLLKQSGDTELEPPQAVVVINPDDQPVVTALPELRQGEDVTQAEFYCIEHELVFPDNTSLTKHYVEVHWGIPQDKLKDESAEPIKRKRGRPKGSYSGGPYSKARKLEDMLKPDGTPLTYTERNPFKCELCLRRFPTQEHITKHHKKAHPGNMLKRVLCHDCGKDFRNKAQFRNHFRIVHEGKKRPPSKRPYHERKKLYICEQCGYTTPETTRLRNHKLSMHEGIMPYGCELCDYRTNEKSDMRRHMHKHEGIKQYACQFCQYRSDQRWLLVNHCQRQHGIQLPKITRDTRGGPFSNRRRKKDAEETGDEFQLQQLITTTEDGQEITLLIPDDMIGEQMISVKEEEIAVEALQQEGQVEEVVYVREDGTILEPEEAALMLLSVAPEEVEESYITEEIQD